MSDGSLSIAIPANLTSAVWEAIYAEQRRALERAYNASTVRLTNYYISQSHDIGKLLEQFPEEEA